MNTTWSFLLLFLSAITGCDTKSEVKGCRDGWFEFTCEYPPKKGTYISVGVQAKQNFIKSTKMDMWEDKGKFSFYHDKKNKNLRVAIKQLQSSHDGKYCCKFDQGSRACSRTEELELEVDDCQNTFNQTAYRTAKTTITCDYPGKKDNSTVKFFCKENGPICEDVLSTKLSLRSNRTFTLTETNSGFNMSISNVSSQHAGVYWCGVESNEGSYQAALRKIQLKVENIRNFTKSPTIGQNCTYWCGYPKTAQNKFICKGEDPSICEPLSTSNHNKKPLKFSMKDDKKKRNITITVINITKEDNGTYWCGAVSTDPRHSNPFFHRFVMNVVPPSPTSPVSSTQSTTVPAGSQVDLAGSPEIVITVVVCVSVLLLLLLVLILILIYKRHLKNKRNAAQHIKEDYIYEEIQEHPQKPDSGHAMNTIYVTANFPTNPSASLHYSTISFKHCSGEAGGQELIPKPSSSVCEYSTVKNSQSPTNSSVHQPSSEDPLYSTVYKAQEQ